MKPIRFTTDRLAKLVCPFDEERTYVKDTATQSLFLCVHRSGKKVFFIVRRVRGRTVRVRLGAWPSELGIADARKEAAKVNGDIAKGEDPRISKLAARGEMTIGDLFIRHIEHAKLHNKTWDENQKQYDLHLSHWRTKRLSDLTRGDVQAFHARLGERSGKYAANRVLALLRHAYAKTAADLGWSGPNPAAGIEKFREQSRTRFLQANELPKLLLSLKSETELFRDFFLLCLLTGARRANVQAMRWDDIHFDRREWSISEAESKSGESIVIPLVPEATAILVRRKLAATTTFVFPSRGKTGHLTEPKSAWRRVTSRAGLADVRLHDLRRTFGSWLTGTGASLPVVGKSLGHKSTASTAVYARLSRDPVRLAVERGTDAMLQAAKGTA
jgi:integrase